MGAADERRGSMGPTQQMPRGSAVRAGPLAPITLRLTIVERNRHPLTNNCSAGGAED